MMTKGDERHIVAQPCLGHCPHLSGQHPKAAPGWIFLPVLPQFLTLPSPFSLPAGLLLWEGKVKLPFSGSIWPAFWICELELDVVAELMLLTMPISPHSAPSWLLLSLGHLPQGTHTLGVLGGLPNKTNMGWPFVGETLGWKWGFPPSARL